MNAPARTIAPGRAWRDAALITAVLWLVLGVGCFWFGAGWVATRLGTGVDAAFVLDLAFLAGVLVVVAVVVAIQRSRGETLRDLGWRRPTTPLAVVVAIVLGLAWTASSYARGGNPLEWSWQRPVMALIGIVLAFGEELAVRGFLMDSLHRGGVPAWVQVVVSGLVMGIYHGILGGYYSVPYAVASAVLFAMVSLVYLLGRRSLTPGLVAHAMTHVLGDPTLTRGILFGVLAMAAGS